MNIRSTLLLLVGLLGLTAHAQIRWTTTNPAPLTIPVRAITAGNDIYVAVADKGTVLISTDAATWQQVEFPSVENLNNVSFANGLFFARGTSGTIFVSDNGRYWLQRFGGGEVASGSALGHDVVYGNGLYLSVPAYYGSSYVRSNDSVTWTKETAAVTSFVTFGSGQFVAGAYNAASLSYSTDGLTWTNKGLSGLPWAHQVVFGAGHFVARATKQLYYSNDAETWTAIPGINVSSLAFVKDRFIANDFVSGASITSLDGVTWTTHASASVTIPSNQIAGTGNTFVGFVGNRLYQSSDAVNWTTSGTYFETKSVVPGVAFAQGRFLSADGRTSTDGITWSTTGFTVPDEKAADANVQAVNNRFFVLSGTSVYASTDGQTGSAVASLSFTARSIAYSNNRYVIVGDKNLQSAAVATSTDGITWTEQAAPSGMQPLRAVAAGAGLFVALGRDEIYTSSDGTVWTLRPHAVTVSSLESVAYGGGRWVVVGSPSLISTDGTTWSYAATVPDGYAVAYANGGFVMASYTASDNNNTYLQPSYGIATSIDGVHWSYRETGGAGARAFAYGNDLWIGANFRGSMIRSASANASLAPSFASELTATFPTENTDDIVISAVASGAQPITYQWFKDGIPVPDATSATYTIRRWRSEWLSTGYTVVATNANGSAMTQYRLSHQSRQIQADDSGLVLAAELVGADRIKLTLGNASSTDQLMLGPGPRHFEWFKNGKPIPNADARSITVAHDPVADLDAIYTVILTNLFGRVAFDFDLAPKVVQPPLSQSRSTGTSATFTSRARVRSTQGDVTFVWTKDGKVVRTQRYRNWDIFNQSLTDTLTVNSITAADYGLYQLNITNNLGTVTTEFFNLGPPEVSRLTNLSVRASVGSGDDVLIAGFVTSDGAATPDLVLRGIGPTLGALGVSPALAQPLLTLKDAGGATLATNAQWDLQPDFDAAFIRKLPAQIGAFPLPANSKDTMIVRSGTSSQGASRFSATVSSRDQGTGIALVEVYEFAPTASRLVNLSARARVGAGNEVLIGGFVIGGTQPLKVLIRGIGPTLGSFGIQNALSNPRVVLYRNSFAVHNNDTWNEAANLSALRTATTKVGAFALNENSNDAVMFETLEPGVYSVQLSSVDGSAGVALLEIYEVP